MFSISELTSLTSLKPSKISAGLTVVLLEIIEGVAVVEMMVEGFSFVSVADAVVVEVSLLSYATVKILVARVVDVDVGGLCLR